MTTRFKPWLPQEALIDGALEERLRELVAEWSGHWLVDQLDCGISLAVGGQEPSGIEPAALHWIDEDKTISACVNASAVQALGIRLMGSPAQSEGDLNQAAMQTLSALVRRSFDDLHERLLALLNVPATMELTPATQAKSRSDYVLAIKFLGVDAVLDYRFDQDFWVRARKAIVQVPARQIDLGTLDQAMEGQVLNIGSWVGKGSITLAEAETISVGDVLVLDSRPDEPMKVTIDKKIVPGLSCRLTQTKKGKVLKLSEISMETSRE